MSMFAEGILVGFYWGPRAEGLDVSTKRLMEFLHRLADLDPMFRNWFKDFGEGQQRIPMTEECMRELLLAGLSYPDVGDQPFKDSGYRVDILNNFNADSFVKLSLQCDEVHPRISNLCLVQAIAGTPAHHELAKIPLLMDLCRLIIDCWKPDRGIVSCNAFAEALESESMSINCGWIMYRSTDFVPLPALPPTARVETIPDRGHLVIASEDITIPPTPQAIDDVRAAFEALEGN